MAIDIKGHGKPLHALTLYCHRDAETDMARWSAPSSFLTAPSCHFILVWRLHCVLLWSVIITPISCHSISFLLDVATDMLLDLEKSVNVAVETNGNIGEDQLDNHRQTSESSNNPAWVSPSSRFVCVDCESLTNDPFFHTPMLTILSLRVGFFPTQFGSPAFGKICFKFPLFVPAPHTYYMLFPELMLRTDCFSCRK